MLSADLDVSKLLSSIYKTKLITFVNPVSYYGFLELEEKEMFSNVYSDGLLLTRLHNIFHGKNKIDRISFDFSSIAGDVLTSAEKLNLNTIFIGGSDYEAKLANIALSNRYPKLNLKCYSGYFSDIKSRNEFIESLNNVDVDIIVSGMGFPQQELFLVQCKKSISRCFVGFTCGGFITQTAIKPDYYSPMVKVFGLRWLQRAFMHKHVRQRLIKDYPIFIYRYINEQIIKNQ
ncbi:TPA: WecB/TagA/CpsF family glycosyltransferase [Photobacterium damselae]